LGKAHFQRREITAPHKNTEIRPQKRELLWGCEEREEKKNWKWKEGGLRSRQTKLTQVERVREN